MEQIRSSFSHIRYGPEKEFLTQVLKLIREQLKVWRLQVEKLNVFGEEVRKLISTDVLENVEATHVVTEVEWGANATMTMNFSSIEESKNTNAAGEMQVTRNLQFCNFFQLSTNCTKFYL